MTIARPALTVASPVRGARSGPGLKSTRDAWESVPFLVQWMNHVCRGRVGCHPVTQERFFEDLRSGLMLCHVVERLVPRADFSRGLVVKPRSAASCKKNLEAALQAVWHRGVRSSRMCTSEEFYACDVLKVTRCLLEIFEALQMRTREVRVKAAEAIRAMHPLLAKMGRPLSEETLHDPLVARNVLAAFGDGARIMALLVHSGRVSSEVWAHVRSCCVLQEHWEENGEVLRQALISAGCPVLLPPTTWSNPPLPFPDNLLYQLHEVWCALPFHGNAVAPQISAQSKEGLKEMTEYRHIRVSREHFLKCLRAWGFAHDAQFAWECMDVMSAGYLSADDFLACHHGVADATAELHQHMSFQLASSLAGSLADASRPMNGALASPSWSTLRFLPSLDHTEDSEEADLALPAGAVALESSIAVEMQAVVPFTETSSGNWQPQSLELLVAAGGGQQARRLGHAEELAWLLDEDERRQLELYESGNVHRARREGAAAAAALEAAEAAREVTEATQAHGASRDSVSPGDLGPDPTTSIQAAVIFSDGSEERMWIQTNVVDRCDDSDSPTVVAEGGVLALEFRRLRDGSDEAPLWAKIAVEEIELIERPGAAQGSRYMLTCPLSADLSRPRRPSLKPAQPEPGPRRLSPGALRASAQRAGAAEDAQTLANPIFRAGPGSSFILCVDAGPSPQRQREVAKFFDELEILWDHMRASDVGESTGSHTASQRSLLTQSEEPGGSQSASQRSLQQVAE